MYKLNYSLIGFLFFAFLVLTACERERNVDYMEGADAMLFMLDLDPSEFDLSVRVLTPFE